MPICCRQSQAIMSNDASPAKPFLKWAGGKRQLIEQIKQRLPANLNEFETYIEPFLGGGAVMFHLLQNRQFNRVIALDLNPELILCYNVVKNNVQQLIDELKRISDAYPPVNSPKKREAFFYDIRKKWNKEKPQFDTLSNEMKIKRVAKTIFLNKTCFNGLFRVNSKGEFNVPFGSYKKITILDEENILKVAQLIQNVQFFNYDFSEALNFIEGLTFIYLDPPYRPLPNSPSFTSYTKSSFNDSKQKELANVCIELDKKSVFFMLSNSDPKNSDKNDDFFDELYSNFKISRIDAKRSINSIGNKRSPIKEILVTNYD